MAFSLYSAVPMPQISWKKENMKLTMAFFHLVGVLIFAFTIFFYFIAKRFSLSPFLFSLILVLGSFFITGGIHKDGFMDSCDGFFSRKEREEALKIMSDSASGAFAVLGAILLVLTSLVSVSEIFESGKFVLSFGRVFVFSRLFSGYGDLTIPKAKKDGMLFSITEEKEKEKLSLSIIKIVFLFWAFLALLSEPFGAIIVLSCFFLSYFFFKKKIMLRFGGITGDLAGFFLEFSQALSFLALAVFGEVF